MFEVDDGVNALNMSFDSLDTEFPILDSVLLILVGLDDDIDFGMNDAIREFILSTGLRIDEDDIPIIVKFNYIIILFSYLDFRILYIL